MPRPSGGGRFRWQGNRAGSSAAQTDRPSRSRRGPGWWGAQAHRHGEARIGQGRLGDDGVPTGLNCTCRSGQPGGDAEEQAKSPVRKGPLESMPVRKSRYRATSTASRRGEDRTSLMVIGCVQRHSTRTCRWSWRCSPTPGRSATTGTRDAPGARPARCRTVAAAPASGTRPRDHHLAPRVRAVDRAIAPELDADCAAALEQHARGLGRCQHLQIRSPHRRPQIGAGAAGAPAAAYHHLVAGGAFLRGTVEIGDRRMARFRRGAQERFDELVAPTSETASGPEFPCSVSAPRTFASERRKYGRTSLHPQPALPESRQRS